MTLLAAASLIAVVACSGSDDDELPFSGDPTLGSGGGYAETGGADPGSGGVAPSTGGGVPSNTGGAPSNTGGVSSNTGGVSSNTGGVPSNTGGVSSNTGGVPSNTGGVSGTCTNVRPTGTDWNEATCDMWATQTGECSASWMIDNHYCDESCGRCTGGSTGGTGNTGGTGGTGNTGTTGGTGNTGSVSDPPRITNPTPGHATHYWDCCKPSCSWPDKGSARSCDRSDQVVGDPNMQSACAGGSAYQCWSMAPWSVSSTLSYGFAAFNEGGCGECYQLEFTGSTSSNYNDPGSAALANKIMIVQKLNTGGIGGGQFDLLVPGGGVGDFDACSSQWNASDLGDRYGGFFTKCRSDNGGNHEAAKSCARQKCQQTFSGGNMGDLLAGCLWWVDWANLADNPNFNYQKVNCPAALSAASGM